MNSSAWTRKHCTRCRKLKELYAFPRASRGLDGTRNICRECKNIQRRIRRVSITATEYQRLMLLGCQICGIKEKLRLDHNHRTGEFRGVLCDACNTSIGLLREDPETIIRAALYVWGELPEAAFERTPHSAEMALDRLREADAS